MEGGNWQDGVGAGFFYTQLTFRRERELFSRYNFDLDGLPDRWKQIIAGRVDWARNERSKNLDLLRAHHDLK